MATNLTVLNDVRNDGTTLGSGATHGAASDTGTTIITLNMFSKAVTEQAQLPKIDVEGLKDVNTHLATAQTHANTWLDTYSKDAWNCLQGIISFGELFTHLYKPLHAAAAKMGDEKEFKPNEIYKLVSALKALQTLVKQQGTEVEKIYKEIVTYSKDVAEDHRVFIADYNIANRELGGTTGEIGQLQKEISTWQDAQNAALAVGGIGATIVVVGGLIIAVGALAEIETAGVSTALVVGGIAVVAIGAVMTVGSIVTYEMGESAIAKKLKLLADDKRELACLIALRGQLVGINGTLQKTSDALANLVTAWQQLDNSIDAVVKDLQDPQAYLEKIKEKSEKATPLVASMIVCAELETANDDWHSTVKFTSSLLEKGRNITYMNVGKKLPTQKNIDDAIKSKSVA